MWNYTREIHQEKTKCAHIHEIHLRNTPGENQMCTYPEKYTRRKPNVQISRKYNAENTPEKKTEETSNKYASKMHCRKYQRNTPPGETKYVHIQEIPGFRYKLPDSS